MDDIMGGVNEMACSIVIITTTAWHKYYSLPHATSSF
jgi:hypothetical protein